MSAEAGVCAHLTVKYTTRQLENNLTRGWWECRDCGTRLMPVFAHESLIAQRDKLLEACKAAYEFAEAADEDLGANHWPQLKAAIALAEGS